MELGPVAWVDGKPIDSADAKIPLMSAAVFRGTSVFDVMLVVDGPNAVGFDAHMNRLFGSAAQMGLRVEYGIDDLSGAAAIVLDAQPTPAIVRTVIADAGPSGGGGDVRPVVAMTAERCDLASEPLRLMTAGAKIGADVLPPGIKVAASYAPGLRVEAGADGRQADGIINFTPDGFLLEALSASVGVVSGRSVRLPPLDVVLDSVTRRIVVDVAESAGIEVVVEMISSTDVATADALFVASTTRPVVPVAQLDAVSYDTANETLQTLHTGLLDLFAGRHSASPRWLTRLD